MFRLQGIKRFAKQLLSHRVFRRSICWRVETNRSWVALTFDDGPHPQFTPMVLDLLNEYEAKGTFFVLGKSVECEPAITARILEEGHELGNHGYDHQRSRMPYQARQCNEIIRSIGARTLLFRPPYGELNPWDFFRLWSRGYSTVFWSCDTLDSQHDAGRLLSQELDYLRIVAGDIVLMHDDNRTCVQELRFVLESLRRSGLTSVVLSDLLAS